MKGEVTQLTELNLNAHSRSFLKEIAGWTYFLSIIGFIFVGLLVIIAVSANSIYNNMAQFSQESPFDVGLFMTAVYVIVALIYFFPILFLFKFSKRLKSALKSKEDEELASALEILKSHYKFIGVFTIIVLSLYALAIIAGLLGVFA
jgi:heme/copper-type cytochrome/quinol oxidase subunit 2